MPSTYSLLDVRERILDNHLVLEADMMELMLRVELQDLSEADESVRGPCAGHVKQRLARLRGLKLG
jgi:hypothetical protein